MLLVQLLTVFEAVLQRLPHLCPVIINDRDLSLHCVNLSLLNRFEVVSPYLLTYLHDSFLPVSELLNELGFGILFALKAL
jgi:hypothetical protein